MTLLHLESLCKNWGFCLSLSNAPALQTSPGYTLEIIYSQFWYGSHYPFRNEPIIQKGGKKLLLFCMKTRNFSAGISHVYLDKATCFVSWGFPYLCIGDVTALPVDLLLISHLSLESDLQVCKSIAKKGCVLPGSTTEGVLHRHVGGIWLVMMTAIMRQQEVSKLQGHLCPVIYNTIHSCFHTEILSKSPTYGF